MHNYIRVLRAHDERGWWRGFCAKVNGNAIISALARGRGKRKLGDDIKDSRAKTDYFNLKQQTFWFSWPIILTASSMCICMYQNNPIVYENCWICWKSGTKITGRNKELLRKTFRELPYIYFENVKGTSTSQNILKNSGYINYIRFFSEGYNVSQYAEARRKTGQC